MKKLPKVYQNELNNNIHNNKKVFDSLKENSINKKKIIKSTKKQSIKEKIKDLINQNKYIFNMETVLVFSDHEEVTNIAGIVNNHIITMDNRIIKIDELKDIYFQKKN